MKKVVFVSLLLASIFLIGSSGVALAGGCQDYKCSGVEMQYGEVSNIYTTEVELCLSKFDADLYGYWFDCELYPVAGAGSSTKNLLGTGDTEYEWAGCSVERRGRSIAVILTYIQEDEGYVDKFNCTLCDDCFEH